MRLLFFFLALLLAIAPACQGLIPEDGTCTLFIYTPFTYNGQAATFHINSTLESSWGFNHMAAALLAVEHFNQRNTTVFSSLADFRDCPIQLQPQFFDSQVMGHAAAQSFVQQQQVPCAIAGPFSDQPALELSTLAAAHEIPLVAYRSFNDQIALQRVHPYSNQLYPDLRGISAALIAALRAMNRSNYVSFLYPATDAGSQRREALTWQLDSRNMRWFATPYQVSADYGDYEALYLTLQDALGKIQQRGYRTIVVSIDDPVTEQIATLAAAAEELDMLNGNYLWVWFGTTELFASTPSRAMERLLEGSAWVAAGEEYFLDPWNDPFWNLWPTLGDTGLVDRLNEANPIAPGQQWHVFAKPTYFETIRPDWGAGMLADAVMSIGIGACLAAAEKANSSSSIISGQEHLQKIRSVDFRGASGEQVRFSPDSKERPGIRNPSTVQWALFNFRNASTIEGYPVEPDLPLPVTMWPVASRVGQNEEWEFFLPFVYANGSTTPPDLRDLPPQNYLSPPLRAFGLALMSFALLLGVITIMWVYVHRKHPVLLAAQPPFLYLIAFGSMLYSLTILTNSFDESFGWSQEQLNHICMAEPWLEAIGWLVSYGALYSKLWRVHRALQFSRQTVGFYRAVVPFVILLALAIVFLTVATVFEPALWVRKIIDNDTDESVGRCRGGQGVLTLIIMVIAMGMAGYYAWKTRDVDSSYSEAWWILVLILLQVEIVIVAIPVVIILYDVSTNGYYFGRVIIAWVFPMSTLTLIMTPKVVAHYRSVNNVPPTYVRGAGGRGSVTVSGVMGREGSNSQPSESQGGGTLQLTELTGPALKEHISHGRVSAQMMTVPEQEPAAQNMNGQIMSSSQNGGSDK